jgi:hypothetical protein
MRSQLLALLTLLSASHMALAQCTSPSLDQQQTMQSLLDKIQQLETRLSQVEEYQRKESATQLVRSTPEGMAERKAQQASVAPTQMAHVHEAMPEEVRETRIHYPSLQIRGFGDVDFSATDQKGSVSGFNLGQFVLHFASALSEKVSYFGEVSLTAQPTAYEVNVERTIIRYDYNDYFKMSFGKYHTPISYWNTAFHHGAWLQTTISRPQMVMFGGALIPIHFVGLQAEGNIPSGPLGLGYNLGLGNGRSSNFSKAGDSGDANNHRAWLANVFARPSWLNDLQFGGSYYHDLLTPQPGANFEERIASANVVYTREKPEILAEVANVHHRDLQTSQTFNTTAYYVQMAYRFPWQENKWKPYYRFEYIHRPSFEPVWDFAGEPSVADLVGSTAGVRYDITNYAAFKGEYRRFRQGIGEPSVNGAFFQTAFTF